MRNEIGDREPSANKKIVLLIAIISSFLTPFISTSVNIALPSIGNSFSLDALSLNWVATIYLLVAAALLVPFGRLADIRGRKMIFQTGMIINSIASILCGISPSGGWLLVFRGLQGIGGAMFFGTAVAILTSVFPPNERGRAIGFSAAATYVGLSVGPLAGGFITQYLGWPWIFYLSTILSVLISIIVFTQLKGEWAESRGEKFDSVGSIFFILSMVILIYSFSLLPAVWGLALILLGLVSFVIFVEWEMKQKFPVLNIGLFRYNHVFALSNAAAWLNYTATTGVAFLLSLYLQYIKGFTAEHSGLILMTQPIVMVICAPIAGVLSDKMEPKIIASIGMVFTTCGMIMLSFLDNSSNILWVFASLFVQGLGFGFFVTPNTNAVMSSVERKFLGVASGILGTMRSTGQAFSLALILLLFSLLIGRVQITPAYFPLFLQTMKIAFIIFSVLCFGAIFTSLARGNIH
jgi:EmrB/QacA subfamily drug resistance transporter